MKDALTIIAILIAIVVIVEFIKLYLIHMKINKTTMGESGLYRRFIKNFKLLVLFTIVGALVFVINLISEGIL
ncbi:hypothetical protein [Clostridium paraputrificum]|uniref:hypothetical protein n=1 Tax=Clostridium sp. TaxID=1506 RepID=UPI0012E87305|nr:hypothetical protein [Clostridium sp.]MBS5985787.1 hypothetical protein [Clostridium sp.]